MNPELKKFKVTPSVVEANKESIITIESLDGRFRFYDDVTYEVRFIPNDETDVPNDELILSGYNDNRNVYSLKPQNGKIKVSHFFKGE